MDSHSIMEYNFDEDLWTELPSLEENLRKYEELVWKMCHSGRRIPLDSTMPRLNKIEYTFTNLINFSHFVKIENENIKSWKENGEESPGWQRAAFQRNWINFHKCGSYWGKGRFLRSGNFFPKYSQTAAQKLRRKHKLIFRHHGRRIISGCRIPLWTLS